MIYCKIGIIAETYESLQAQLKEVEEELKRLQKLDGGSSTNQINEHEGSAVSLNRDKCWDYATPVHKHIDMLM